MIQITAPSPIVTEVRSASRDLVRQLGLMSRTVAGTDLSISAVHAIIELGNTGELSSKQLGERLLLEKSTISRLVKSLAVRGEVSETRSGNDARIKHLHLTRQGQGTFEAIEKFTNARVSGALGKLTHRSQRGVLKGLREYSAALGSPSSQPDHEHQTQRFQTKAGYAPALIGSVVAMMHSHMNKHYGFGLTFERRIASDLVEFMSRIDEPGNCIWRAECNGRIIGSISIDGHHSDDGYAHLRWFVVGEEARGAGTGRELLSRALEFCDGHGYREIHLWTVKGLDAARKLYEDSGFELADEYQGDQWGTSVTEQKFIRRQNQLATALPVGQRKPQAEKSESSGKGALQPCHDYRP